MRSGARIAALLGAVIALASGALGADTGVDVAQRWSEKLEPALTEDYAKLALRFTGPPPSRYSALGLVSMMEDFPEGAVWAFSKAVLAEPGSGRRLSNLGLALMTIGQDADALSVLHEAVAKGGGASAEANLGRAYSYAGDKTKAERTLRAACAAHPDSVPLWTAYLDLASNGGMAPAGAPEVDAARDGLIEALGGTEEVLARTSEVLDALYGKLESDHRRAAEILNRLADRAAAGVPDEIYSEHAEGGFRNKAEMAIWAADQTAAMAAAARERLAAGKTAVETAQPMGVFLMWNMLIERCIGEIAGAAFGYLLAHAGGQLDVLFWTDMLGEDDLASEAYWMELSPFRPVEDHWWEAQEAMEEALQRAVTAEMGDAIRRRFCSDMYGTWDGFVPGWERWSGETAALYKDKSAEWVAEKLYWVGVLRNAIVVLDPLTVGADTYRQRMGGQPTYAIPRDQVIKTVSLFPDDPGLGDGLERLGDTLHRHMEWTYTKSKYHGGGGYLGDLAWCEGILDDACEDERGFGLVAAAMELLVCAARGELPPVGIEAPLTRDLTFGVQADGKISLAGDVSVILEAARIRFANLNVIGAYNVRTGVWSAELEASITAASLLAGLVPKPDARKAIEEFSETWMGSPLGAGVKGSLLFDSQGKRALGLGCKLPSVSLLGEPHLSATRDADLIFEVDLVDIPGSIRQQLGILPTLP